MGTKRKKSSAGGDSESGRIAAGLKGLAVAIDSVAPDPGNARAHSSANLDANRGSLLACGQQRPILVDARGVSVAGNGLYQAARALGWRSIAVVRTKLSGAERTAYALADNRTAELAEWSPEVTAPASPATASAASRSAAA